MTGTRNFMGTLRSQSAQDKNADLESFMDEYQSELFWSYPSEIPDSSLDDSYPVACRLHAPILARFITNKINDILFSNHQDAILIYAGIERAIFHLYSGNDAESKYYTKPAWQIVLSADAALLNALFSNCDNYEKTIGRKKILDRNDASIFVDTTESCEQWNLLAEAAVFNRDIRVVNQIAARYPAAVAPALEAFAAAEKLFERYPQAIFCISPEDIRRARRVVILALTSPLHDFYTVSYEDKRDIEKDFLAKIQSLHSAADVLDFYERYDQAFVLNQHRLYAWACFKQFIFRRPEMPYSTLRCHVLEALQKKFFESVSEYSSPSVMAKGREILFSDRHFLRGVSVEWRDRINPLFNASNSLLEITEMFKLF
jgi:hypothetical protein